MQCPRCETTIKAGLKFCPVCGAGLPSWTGRLQSGDQLAQRYLIVRPVARGGMGAVYLAHDARLGDAPVALKEMTLFHAPGDTETWERAVDEFRREASLLARLSHPNLPHVIDQFEANGNQFLVMEFVDGRTLRAELESRTAPVPLDEALDWFKQLTSVLSYLHAQQPPIIYRDLKPANIMVRPDGRIALIDFGIARIYKVGQAGDTVIYGTPGYAPPEQYGLGQTDPRTDLYSLAMVMHEILTGHDPVRRKHMRPALVNEVRADVPAHIAQAINQALALEPEDRFASIAEFNAAMRPPAVVITGRVADRSSADSQSVVAVQIPVIGEPAPAPQPVAALAQPVRQRSWGVLLGTASLMMVVGLLSLAILNNWVSLPGIAGPTTITSVTPTITPPPAPPAMVTIPAGEFVMGSADMQPDERPSGSGYLPLFFIDRTEVTNADYQRCVQTGACTPPLKLASLSRPDYYTNTKYADYPVIHVTWNQAVAYCRAQGKRLPSEAEWEKAARGTDARIYPWGNTWNSKLLNAWGDRDKGDTMPVGSYPRGASPYGALDMVGNVWEWTNSLDVPYPYSAGDGREAESAPGLRIIRGGSWGKVAANARAADRDRRAQDEFNDNLGLRCATSKPVAGMDYIPAGTWTMGASPELIARWEREYSWVGFTNERPTTVITTPAFYLDHTEVTNRDYQEFMSATGQLTPTNSFDPVGLAVWQPDGTVPVTLSDHPVVNVTWGDASAYCAWRKKRLPSESEWERAAKGDDLRAWPWGDQWDLVRANTMESKRGTTLPVGSIPANAGPYGTLDLAGNVWEWTSSVYLPYPYKSDAVRAAPDSLNSRALRGGSWMDGFHAARTSGRNSFLPTFANNNVGFRCAMDGAN